MSAVYRFAGDGRPIMMCGVTSKPDPDIDICSVYQPHRRILDTPIGNQEDFRVTRRLIARGDVSVVIDSVLPLKSC